jgi:hypothetical protein
MAPSNVCFRGQSGHGLKDGVMSAYDPTADLGPWAQGINSRKLKLGQRLTRFRTIQVCPKDLPAALRQVAVRKTERTGPVGGAGSA